MRRKTCARCQLQRPGPRDQHGIRGTVARPADSRRPAALLSGPGQPLQLGFQPDQAGHRQSLGGGGGGISRPGPRSRRSDPLRKHQQPLADLPDAVAGPVTAGPAAIGHRLRGRPQLAVAARADLRQRRLPRRIRARRDAEPELFGDLHQQQHAARDLRLESPVRASRSWQRQLSESACVEGQTWGYDNRRGLWVNNGCSGRFVASRQRPY